VLPRGRVYGAQHDLGNKGLGKMGLGNRGLGKMGWSERVVE
jgi:hypothetical protein